MRNPIRVLILSSVLPRPTGFGEITLYRHFANEPSLAVTEVPYPKTNKLVHVLRRLSFRKSADSLEFLRGGRRWDAKAYELVDSVKPELIFTEAAGDAYHSALRLSRRTGLPLVSRFSDWWPDLVHPWTQAREEACFRQLYRQSRIALCVSEGMRRELREHQDSRLLWPISGTANPAAGNGFKSAQNGREPFKLCYSGNLREYGPMIESALKALRGHPNIRLEVRGMSPRWPVKFRQEMQRLEMYHEFAPREEFERWLGSADAFLITSAFEPAMRRLMETNFPSKLLEFARFGKPLVAWGPDYSTLIGWAKRSASALAVTDETPQSLVRYLEQLVRSPVEQKRLGSQATRAISSEFDPVVIQEEFLRAIRDSARAPRPWPAREAITVDAEPLYPGRP